MFHINESKTLCQLNEDPVTSSAEKEDVRWRKGKREERVRKEREREKRRQKDNGKKAKTEEREKL